MPGRNEHQQSKVIYGPRGEILSPVAAEPSKLTAMSLFAKIRRMLSGGSSW